MRNNISKHDKKYLWTNKTNKEATKKKHKKTPKKKKNRNVINFDAKLV